MKIKQRLLKFIMITAIPLFCISCAVFGVALALKSVNVEMDGMFNYTPASDFIFTPIDGTTNCSVKLANTNITTADIPETATISGTTYTVTEIEENGFEGISITSVTLPNSITSIGEYAFKNTSLTSITIPASVTSIGAQAFSNTNLVDATSGQSQAKFEDEYDWFTENGESLGNIYILSSKYFDDALTKMPDVSTLSDFSFTYDGSTASIEKSSTSISGKEKCLYIPRWVTCEGSVYTVTTIPWDAFYQCTNIKYVYIPQGVSRIDGTAFEGCSNLTSVTFEKTDWYAASYGWGASSELLDLSNASTSATYLTDAYKDFNLHSLLDESEYSHQYSFDFSSDKTASISSAKDSANNNIAGNDGGTLFIPAYVKHNGETYTVTSIQSSGFANCKMETIYTPSTITSMGDYAFSSCTKLDYICTSVYSVGCYAFEGASNLSEASLCAAVYIGAYAFNGSSLTSLYLRDDTNWCYNDSHNGSNWTKASDFYDNKEIYLTSTYVDRDWSWSEAATYSQLTFSYNKNDFTASVKCSSTSISGAVEIPAYVTYYGQLYTVTSIANGGFNNCQSITSVTIPYTIVRIENHAFHMCYSLTTFETNWELASKYGATSSITYIGEAAFAGTQFTELFIPSSVTYIGKQCFGAPNGNASGILSVTFADKNNWYQEENGTYTAITFSSTGSENVTYFKDERSFYKILPASATLSFTYDDTNMTATVAKNSDNLPTGDLVIPALVVYDNKAYDVTSIGDKAFMGCSSLTSITIPSSVTTIGYEAFYNCTGLTNITIPSSVTTIGYSSGSYTTICSGCTSLISINVESGNTVYHSAGNCIIETASKTLVQGCKTSIIPSDDSVTSIKNGAFYRCTGLTNITIPSSVTSIGDSAFDGCTGLTSITIPSSVTSIGDSAFRHCTGLTSITIPSSVTSIGDYAFYNCTSLTSVTIQEGVTRIGNYAFDDCTALTSITIPNSVTSIGEAAFYNCTSLTSIIIPSSVTSIGTAAFSRCTSLTSISVESGNTVYHSNGNCLIETASKTLVQGCKTSIIPSDGSVTSIGSKAFQYCTGLTSITISESVTEIGEKAFSECTSLATVTIDSDTISNGLTSASACGNLIENATTVYIKEECSTSSSTYLTNNFTQQETSDQSGYVKWVKN